MKIIMRTARVNALVNAGLRVAALPFKCFRVDSEDLEQTAAYVIALEALVEQLIQERDEALKAQKAMSGFAKLTAEKCDRYAAAWAKGEDKLATIQAKIARALK